jgi:ferredoxin-NADP reductase
MPVEQIKRIVFVAGGVGINPLMSMVSAIAEEKGRGGLEGVEVQFLYSVKCVERPVVASQVLFLQRLEDIFHRLGKPKALKLFLTGRTESEGVVEGLEPQIRSGIEVLGQRIKEEDLEGALGDKANGEGTVVYVCGVPKMTDWMVEYVGKAEGMSEDRVFCEKWW